MPPIIEKEKCVFCTVCAEICPLNVLKADKEKKEIVVRYPEECWHCRACVVDCPKEAVSIRYPLSHFMLHREPNRGGTNHETSN